MNPVGPLLVAAGMFAIAGGACDWDWFMTHRKARLLVAILGRAGARIFYATLGLSIVVIGGLITAGIIQDAR